MKSKKGYALATTLAVMVFVMALSTLVLVLIQSLNINKQIVVKNFEKNIIITQIATDINTLEQENFITKYETQNFTKTIQNTNIRLENKDKDLVITIKIIGNEKFFNVKNFDLSKNFLTIHKIDNTIVLWKYL